VEQRTGEQRVEPALRVDEKFLGRGDIERSRCLSTPAWTTGTCGKISA